MWLYVNKLSKLQLKKFCNVRILFLDISSLIQNVASGYIYDSYLPLTHYWLVSEKCKVIFIATYFRFNCFYPDIETISEIIIMDPEVVQNLLLLYQLFRSPYS